MPTYRCIQSRRIADTAFVSGIEYQLPDELVQRYAGYFTRVESAPARSEYDDPVDEPVDVAGPAESLPAASKRRRK